MASPICIWVCSDGLISLAVICLGDYKEATQIFQQALKLDPDSKLPLKYMYKTAKKLWSMKDETNVVFQQHRFEEAIKGYSNVCSSPPCERA